MGESGQRHPDELADQAGPRTRCRTFDFWARWRAVSLPPGLVSSFAARAPPAAFAARFFAWLA